MLFIKYIDGFPSKISVNHSTCTKTEREWWFQNTKKATGKVNRYFESYNPFCRFGDPFSGIGISCWLISFSFSRIRQFILSNWIDRIERKKDLSKCRKRNAFRENELSSLSERFTNPWEQTAKVDIMVCGILKSRCSFKTLFTLEIWKYILKRFYKIKVTTSTKRRE